MNSRRLLWSFLVLGALPFFFEATTGCDVVFGLERLAQDNALHCACTCDAQAARSPMVVRSADDAEEDPSPMTVVLASADLDLGRQIAGIRFTDLGIPQGTRISNAYVQFTSQRANQTESATYTIHAEDSTAPLSFTSTNGNVSGRTVLPSSVAWAPSDWPTLDEAGSAQRTEDIGDLLQQLVDDPSWNETSSLVLRFEGTGHRAAWTFDGKSSAAPKLVVGLGVEATLPICASPIAVVDVNRHLTPASQELECSRVAVTLSGLANACGYPTPCNCQVVDARDPSGADRPDSFQADVCDEPCDEMVVDGTCTNFDPNAFSECLAAGGSLAQCKTLVSATNAAGGVPYCVASGSALAFHAFGERTLCEVTGVADVVVGDRRPKNDPATAGTVEILGGPCPGGSCPVTPYFDLVMNPIEFEVRWASNPVFRNLGAAGRGLETTVANSFGDAVFDEDTILGTGAGRRGLSALAIDATNTEPLGLGADWTGRVCALYGTLAAGVGDDGVCESDDTTPCASDDDCFAVGGACTPAADTDEMLVDLALDGEIVNQPPRANAGADQIVECTSPAGGSFTIDGRGSSDPDQDLALTSWHLGTRTGLELGRSPVVQQALGVGMSMGYVLRVVDTFAQTDEDTTTAAVVDTTPPELAISVSPTTLWPPQHKFVPVTVAVTTSDVCDPSPAIRLLSITSSESPNGLGDGSTSPDVQGALFGSDDRQFLLRSERSGNGPGRIYTITYEARDFSGNATLRQATVAAPKRRP